MSAVLCVDVGSTFTKAVLVDEADGTPLATASCPTTLAGDVLDGVAAVRDRAERAALPTRPAWRWNAPVAFRRHGRLSTPAVRARSLREVRLVVGSGGVLRHGDAAARARILAPLLTDHGGGWIVPEHARLAVDARDTLFAAGLLAPYLPMVAVRLAAAGLVDVRDRAWAR